MTLRKRSYAIVFLVALGVAARLRDYLACRSLWLDEAALANNVIKRSLLGMFDALDHDQVAPPGFLILAKLAHSLFGCSEYALRLVPLLAGLGAIPLAYALGREWLSKTCAATVACLTAVSPACVYYSGEFKQYSTDVFLCFAALLLTTYVIKKDGARTRITLAAFGAIGIWVSHPLVIVLLAGCATLFYRDCRLKGPRQRAASAATGLAFLASAAGLYMLTRGQARSAGMYEYWSSAFLPLPPRSMEEFKNSVLLVFGLFCSPFQPINESLFIGERMGLLAASLWTVGIGLLCKQRSTLASMLVVTTVGLLAASALHQYPAQGRLVLFLTPVIFMGLSAGIDALAASGRAIQLVFLTGMLAFPIMLDMRTVASPKGAEELRPILENVDASAQPGDILLVHEMSEMALEYYRDCRGASFGGLSPVKLPQGKDLSFYRKAFEEYAGKRVWLVLSHAPPREESLLLLALEDVGTRLSEYRATGAAAFLYGLR